MNSLRMVTVALLLGLLLGGGRVLAQEAPLIDGVMELTESVAEGSAADTASIGGKQVLEKSIETCAKKFGLAETKRVFSTVGPEAVNVMENASGKEAPEVFKFMAKKGMDSLYVVGRPGRMAIFLKFGDAAGDAMLKQKGIAEAFINKFGEPAIGAMNAVNEQNAVRLGKMSASGELTAGGQPETLLKVVGKYGDKAMNFIWRHKGALAVGTTLTAFLANPQPFIDGTKSLTSDTVGAIIRRVNWTPIALLALVLVAIWIGSGRWRKRPV